MNKESLCKDKVYVGRGGVEPVSQLDPVPMYSDACLYRSHSCVREVSYRFNTETIPYLTGTHAEASLINNPTHY